MYAIIEDSGKQFKLTTGDKLRLDRPLEQHEAITNGKTLTLDRVLLVAGTDAPAKIGQPTVAGATVSVEVLGSVRGKKLVVEKHSRRKRYHRRHGHRQNYIEVKVTAINA
jgi:large subunit ribosomal protein L21